MGPQIANNPSVSAADDQPDGRQHAGRVLAIALSIAAIFAVGLSVAAVALTAGAARGIMAATFYPLIFFSGLYIPYNSPATYGSWCHAGSRTPSARLVLSMRTTGVVAG